MSNTISILLLPGGGVPEGGGGRKNNEYTFLKEKYTSSLPVPFPLREKAIRKAVYAKL